MGSKVIQIVLVATASIRMFLMRMSLVRCKHKLLFYCSMFFDKSQGVYVLKIKCFFFWSTLATYSACERNAVT